MPKIYKRAAAQRDIIGYYVYLAENASTDTAASFLLELEASFMDLASQPYMGAPLKLRRPELAGLRKWRVKGFENVLIFYFPRPNGVSIVRLLHATRDWWRLLGMA